LVVTPLPDSPPFSLSLDLASMRGRKDASVSAVRTCELGGDAPGAAVAHRVANGWLTFKHDGKSACYRVDL